REAALLRRPLDRGGGPEPRHVARHRLPPLDVRPRLAAPCVVGRRAGVRWRFHFCRETIRPGLSLEFPRPPGRGRMMPPQFQRVKAVFLAAVEMAEPAKRAAYLDAECDSDALLRHQVEALLQKHEQAGNFLNPPPTDFGPTVDRSNGGSPSGRVETPAVAPAESAGDRVGPYKLLQKLAEGGMGVVWVAEQTESVKRRVALKVIKPGM